MNVAKLWPWLAVCFASASMACQPLRDLDAASSGTASASGSGAFTESTTNPVFPTPSSSSTNPSSVVAAPVMQGSPSHAGLTTAPDSKDTTTGAGETSGQLEMSTSTSNESSTSTTLTRVHSDDASSTETASTEEPRDNSDLDSTTTSNAGSSAPSSTSEPSGCQSQCGLGEACTSATECLSLRCDDSCSPTEIIVHSDGLDAISTSIKVHVELYADPAVPIAWKDLAVLYFFTVERRDDFVMHFQQGGGEALPVQVGLTDWILVWRSDHEGNVPSTVTPFDVQFRSDPWLPDIPESNDNSNDHSYREGLGPNDNIVLCRQVDGGWKQIQGTAPTTIPDPCHYIDNCDAALSCDPLQPAE